MADGQAAGEQAADEQPARTSGERRLWRGIGVIVLATALVVGAGQAWTAMAQRNDSSALTFPASVTALDLDLEDGTVNVVGDSEQAVTVRQNLNWTLRRPQVEHSLSGNVLTIKVRCLRAVGVSEPGCGAYLDIRVPRAMAVTARVTSGQTTISRVSGDLSLRATSGEVGLDDVSGRIAARVSSGRIAGTRIGSSSVRAEVTSGEVDLTFATAPDDLTLTGSSGSLSAALPSGSRYRVTGHGKVDFDPAMLDPQSPHTITMSTGSGKGSLSYAAG